MQRPHPSGGLHRFFAPACAVTAGIKKRDSTAKKEEKADETESDIPASSPLLCPPATKPLVEEAAAAAAAARARARDAAPRVTYSRRKKTRRPDESEDDEKEARQGACSIASLPSTTVAAAAATTTTGRQPPPPTNEKKKMKKALTQTHLDLGQAAFVCLTCRQCGMVYAPGDAGDERTHQRFHADALLGPRLPAAVASSAAASSAASAASSSSSSSLLEEAISFPATNGSGSSSRQGGGPARGASSLRGRVLHARPGPALAGAGVSRALAVAEAALGAAPGWLLGTFSAAAAAAASSPATTGCDEQGAWSFGGVGEGCDRGCGGVGGASAPPSPRARPARSRPALSAAAAAARSGKHAFLFECSETRRAVGVAVVESLASWTRLRRRRVGGGEGGESGGGGGGGESGGGESVGGGGGAGEGTETEAATETTTAGAAGAALGVRGIWVAPSHRRRGVASALLDAARARAVTYTVVGRRELVAFSQPGEAGGALARSYAGEGFWSYL